MSTIPHGPTPACEKFAPLLPLAAHALLNPELDTLLREHVAVCAYCSSEVAAHAQVDAALRDYLTRAPGATPPFSQEGIVRLLTQASHQPGSAHRSAPITRLEGRPRHIPAILPAAAAVVLIAVFAQYVFSLSKGHRGFGGSSIPVTGSVPANVDVKSITMVSPSEGWAVGSTTPPRVDHGCWMPQPSVNFVNPVMLHFTDGRWNVVPNPPDLTPRSASVVLRSVSMDSAADGWAVGNTVLPSTPDCVVDGITSGQLLHYTAGRWVVVATSLGSELESVFMRSASDGWIVGVGTGGGGPLVLHFDGSRWTQVSSAAFTSLSLNTVTALSATDVWMAGIDLGGTAPAGNGFDGNAPAILLHYDGHIWIRQSIPILHARLQSLAMVSASEGWAVGVALGPNTGGGAGDPTKPNVALILRYHDGRWQEQSHFAGPAGTYLVALSSVRMLSSSEGWAVGTGGLIVHYIRGLWVRVPSPTRHDLVSVAIISPSEAWAVGDGGTLLHDTDGSWRSYDG